MIRGLYTSALGMTTQMKKMDVVANNIANVDTTGFKRDTVVTQSFSEELMRRLHDESDWTHGPSVGKVSQGVFVDDVYTDFSVGSFRTTGGDLDLALNTQGFFVVNMPDAEGNMIEKYTRDGALTLTADGTLMTKDGCFVAGENGNIVLPNGSITIDESGFIYVGGELIDRIQMTDFEDLHSLRKFGSNLYDTTDDSTEIPYTGGVLQGMLENSNVNSVREMVDMITVNRAYEANQRMVTIHDTTLGRAVNDIARK